MASFGLSVGVRWDVSRTVSSETLGKHVGVEMSKYHAPKKRLHRDFVYLDSESVLNSLSAFEAGEVDTIIEKTTDATDREAGGGLEVGPVKGKLAKRREYALQAELVKKRTWFSAFEAWYQKLCKEEAIGSFDDWDLTVRDDLRVGDTLEFEGRIRLSPLHLLFATFASYAKSASPRSATMKISAGASAEARKTAQAMQELTKGPGGSQSSSVYFEPHGASAGSPRIVGRVDTQYLLRGLGELDGVFSVVAQVEALLAPGDELPAIRLIRDTPPTPIETKSIRDAFAAFKGSAIEGLGVHVEDGDVTYVYPTVVVRPIAIYR
jgi:hypothetical protein